MFFLIFFFKVSCWGHKFVGVLVLKETVWWVEVAGVAGVVGSGGRQEMVKGEKKKEEKCQRRTSQTKREKKG